MHWIKFRPQSALIRQTSQTAAAMGTRRAKRRESTPPSEFVGMTVLVSTRVDERRE